MIQDFDPLYPIPPVHPNPPCPACGEPLHKHWHDFQDWLGDWQHIEEMRCECGYRRATLGVAPC